MQFSSIDKQINFQKISKAIKKHLGSRSQDIAQKCFTIGYLFSHFHLNNVKDIQICLQQLNNIDDLVLQGVINEDDKSIIIQTLLKIKFQGEFTIERLKKQFQRLADFYINQAITRSIEKQEQAIKSKILQKYQIIDNIQKQQINTTDPEKESLQLAKKIQQQQEREYINQKSKIISNTFSGYDCPICLQSIQFQDIALLSCNHSFHRECVGQSFKQNIDDRKFPIKCPNGQCKKDVLSSDIVEYLSNQYVQKYQDFTFNQYVDAHVDQMSWCPTAGCQFVFLFDKQTTILSCPLCRKQYCLNCKVQYHRGMNCKQYEVNRRFDKNDQQFITFVKGAKYKQCPKCKFWVQKNQGCDHMTCRCKFEFCYICGGVYNNCDCKNQTNNNRNNRNNRNNNTNLNPNTNNNRSNNTLINYFDRARNLFNRRNSSEQQQTQINYSPPFRNYPQRFMKNSINIDDQFEPYSEQLFINPIVQQKKGVSLSYKLFQNLDQKQKIPPKTQKFKNNFKGIPLIKQLIKQNPKIQQHRIKKEVPKIQQPRIKTEVIPKIQQTRSKMQYIPKVQYPRIINKEFIPKNQQIPFKVEFIQKFQSPRPKIEFIPPKINLPNNAKIQISQKIEPNNFRYSPKYKLQQEKPRVVTSNNYQQFKKIVILPYEKNKQINNNKYQSYQIEEEKPKPKFEISSKVVNVDFDKKKEDSNKQKYSSVIKIKKSEKLPN